MHRKKILVVDDEKLIRWSVRQKLNEWDLEVVEAEDGREALQVFPRESPDLVILDVNLPDEKGTELLKQFRNAVPELPVVMVTAYGSIDDAVSAMRSGAYDFITKPINFLKLRNTIQNALETVSLKQEVAYYKEKEQERSAPGKIVAADPATREVMQITRTIAESEAAIVLLQGESGTGKDLLAQTIHHQSRRKAGPFLVINCSAIPENLLESELFGYEKGAFTDAKNQKRGLAEMAHTGTLFLDEISTLSLPLQAKLLRFLETQIFKRVGGLRDIEVDLRVIAATNRDLEAASLEGAFRRDLFFRLNVCPIHIPPLRDRMDDILPLSRHFIEEYNRKFRKDIKGLNKQAERMFLDYLWPGNVRELKNALERAMIFEKGTYITPSHLPFQPGRPGALSSVSKQAAGERSAAKATMSLEEMEHELLIKALKKASGNKSQAARILGITRDTLRYKIQKWGLKEEDWLNTI
jgi:DNA-binding NtrC family response regulator